MPSEIFFESEAEVYFEENENTSNEWENENLIPQEESGSGSEID